MKTFARGVSRSWVVLLAIVVACSSSSSAGPSETGAPDDQQQQGDLVSLKLLEITPASASAHVGSTRQLMATANYSDGTTKDVTTSCTWASSVHASATVSSKGLVTAIAPGETTLSAEYQAVVGTATFTVLTN